MPDPEDRLIIWTNHPIGVGGAAEGSRFIVLLEEPWDEVVRTEPIQQRSFRYEAVEMQKDWYFRRLVFDGDYNIHAESEWLEPSENSTKWLNAGLAWSKNPPNLLKNETIGYDGRRFGVICGQIGEKPDYFVSLWGSGWKDVFSLGELQIRQDPSRHKNLQAHLWCAELWRSLGRDFNRVA